MRLATGVNEASDVCALPGDRFLAVSDVAGAAGIVALGGQTASVPLEQLTRAPSGLEGVAYNEARKLLVVSSEEARTLHVYDWDALSTTAPHLQRVVTVPLGGKANKGVEGLASLPAHLSPTGRDQLLLVKEGDPRMLALLEADGTGTLQRIQVDPRAEEACTDFSGVAVDPLTGHVWICSDETGRAAELKLVLAGGAWHAELVSEPLELKDADGQPLQRVEGLAFSSEGDLFVLTENERVLHHLARQ